MMTECMSNSLQQYHLHKSWLLQKRGYTGAKALYREHTLAYKTIVICGSFEVLTSATIVNKCGVKDCPGKQEHLWKAYEYWKINTSKTSYVIKINSNDVF